MGFERQKVPLLRMEFDDGPLGGLVIVFRAAPMSAIRAADQAFDAYRDAPDFGPRLMSAMYPLASELAPLVVAWNLEEGGAPVPVQSLMDQPAAFVSQIAERWMLDLFAIPHSAPAPAPAVDDKAEIEGELPMESLPEVESA